MPGSQHDWYSSNCHQQQQQQHPSQQHQAQQQQQQQTSQQQHQIHLQQQQLHQLHQVNTASLPTPPPNEHSPLGGLVGNHSFGAGLMLGQTATPQLHHLHSIGGLIAGTQSY